MPDEISIANGALRSLGANTITAFTEGSTGAKLANESFYDLRDSFLQIHPWKFATIQAQLTSSGTSPQWGWLYQYELPNEPFFCLRVLYVNGENLDSGRWQRREHKIVTDLGSPIEITYLWRSNTYGDWHPAAIRALSHYLASEWAMALTKNTEIADRAEAKYERSLRRAKAANGAEGTPMQLETNTWVDSRLGANRAPLVDPAS